VVGAIEALNAQRSPYLCVAYEMARALLAKAVKP
jgi:hypothetical protein